MAEIPVLLAFILGLAEHLTQRPWSWPLKTDAGNNKPKVFRFPWSRMGLLLNKSNDEMEVSRLPKLARKTQEPETVKPSIMTHKN